MLQIVVMNWKLKVLGGTSLSYGHNKLRSHFRRMGMLAYLALERKPIPYPKLISLLCEHAGDENKDLSRAYKKPS